MDTQYFSSLYLSVVNMIQLIIGAALGTLLGQGLLFGVGRLFSTPQAEDLRNRVPTLPPVRGSALIAGFIKYAGALGACVALVTLGVWAVEDYLGARSAHSASRAHLVEATAQTPPPVASNAAGPTEITRPAPEEKDSAVSAWDDNSGPYSDPDFKVHRKPHRAGGPLSLKETLVQRSEAQARADLLKEMQQRVSRSQYDCEAAEHADRYLKADLDVWGFSAWQFRYYPTDSYKGATLPQCMQIETVVDHSAGFATNRR